MKKTVLAGLLLTFSIFAFSQTNASDSSWKTLEYAQVAFDCGNYGEALRLANKASAQRKAEIQHEYNIMEVAITPKQVQRGDIVIFEGLNGLTAGVFWNNQIWAKGDKGVFMFDMKDSIVVDVWRY